MSQHRIEFSSRVSYQVYGNGTNRKPSYSRDGVDIKWILVLFTNPAGVTEMRIEVPEQSIESTQMHYVNEDDDEPSEESVIINLRDVNTNTCLRGGRIEHNTLVPRELIRDSGGFVLTF